MGGLQLNGVVLLGLIACRPTEDVSQPVPTPCVGLRAEQTSKDDNVRYMTEQRDEDGRIVDQTIWIDQPGGPREYTQSWEFNGELLLESVITSFVNVDGEEVPNQITTTTQQWDDLDRLVAVLIEQSDTVNDPSTQRTEFTYPGQSPGAVREVISVGNDRRVLATIDTQWEDGRPVAAQATSDAEYYNYHATWIYEEITPAMNHIERKDFGNDIEVVTTRTFNERGLPLLTVVSDGSQRQTETWRNTWSGPYLQSSSEVLERWDSASSSASQTTWTRDDRGLPLTETWFTGPTLDRAEAYDTSETEWSWDCGAE